MEQFSEAETLSVMKASSVFLRRRRKLAVEFFSSHPVDIGADLMDMAVSGDPLSYVFAS